MNKDKMDGWSEMSIPVGIYHKEKDGRHYLMTTDETSKMFGFSTMCYGDTKEKAIKDFQKMAKEYAKYMQSRARQADRWTPIQIGQFRRGKTMSSGSITIFGISFYFRIGNNMKHGWYVPGTALNISIRNYWKNPVYDC